MADTRSRKSSLLFPHTATPYCDPPTQTETTAQLFSHFPMKEESFNVDAFNERDNTGVLGRMGDVLGNSMSASQISIDKPLSNLVGEF